MNKKSKSKSSIFNLQKDVLKKYGYKNIKSKSKLSRHRSLKKAMKYGIKPLSLLRRLNALFVLNKNKDPIIAEIFKDDSDYIRTTKEYKER